MSDADTCPACHCPTATPERVRALPDTCSTDCDGCEACLALCWVGEPFVGIHGRGAGRTMRVDLDGDETTCSLGAFLDANADGLSDEEQIAIGALVVGASFSGGGGAAPVWTVTRVS